VKRLLELAARFDILNHNGVLAQNMDSNRGMSLTRRMTDPTDPFYMSKDIIQKYVIPNYGYKAIRKEDEAALLQNMRDIDIEKHRTSRMKSKNTTKRRASSSTASSSSLESFTESTISRKSRKPQKSSSTASSPMSSLSPGTPDRKKKTV
jgi:hypothetical protein